MDSDREGTIYVQLPKAFVFNVEGKTKTQVDSGEFVVLCVNGTVEECKVLANVGGPVNPDPEKSSELYFAICGEYKIPLAKCVPVIKMEERCYTFVLPEGLFLEFQFPVTDVSDDEIEVLECLLNDFAAFRTKRPSVCQMPSPSAPPPPALQTATATTSNTTTTSTTATKGVAASASPVAPTPGHAAVSAAGEAAMGEEPFDHHHHPVKPTSTAVAVASPVAIAAAGAAVPTSKAEKLAHGIAKTGDVVSGGIEAGSDKLNQILRAGGDKMVAKLKPNEKPLHVDESTMRNLRRAKKVTAVACTVSGKAVKTLLGVTRAVSERLAKKVGPALGGAAGRSDSIRLVATTAIQTAVQVMDAVTDAGKELVHTTGQEVTKVVGHKYGPEAQEAARVGAGMASDAVEVAMNIKAMEVKCLARATGKDAVKQVFAQAQANQIVRRSTTPPKELSAPDGESAANKK